MTDEELKKTLQNFDNTWMDNDRTPKYQEPNANLFSEIDKILSEEAGVQTPDTLKPSFSEPIKIAPEPVAPQTFNEPEQVRSIKVEPKPIVPQPRRDFHPTKDVKPEPIKFKPEPIKFKPEPIEQQAAPIEFQPEPAYKKEEPITFVPVRDHNHNDTLSFDDMDDDNMIDRTDDSDKAGPISKVFRTTCCIVICFVIAVGISFLITHFVAHHTMVEGSSMNPTLQNGDQIVVENVSYYLHDPERFDVVVFPFSKGVYYIKRVIGIPGETVQIKDGKVYINGQVLRDDTYCKDKILDAGLAQDKIKLGYDEYFVLGDNRNVSVDSRKESVGVVHKGEISGKAWVRFFPFGSIGKIK